MKTNKCSEKKTKELPWRWKLMKRRLLPDDLLFEEGDIYCRLLQKCLPVDTIDTAKRVSEFSCGITNCCQTFDSLIKYECHYNSSHRHVCQTCQRMFPSAHLLDTHILETHDVMFSLLAQKQNMFQCLLADCLSKFKTSNERKNHMVKIHRYPPSYRYDRSKTNRTSENTVAGNERGTGWTSQAWYFHSPGSKKDNTKPTKAEASANNSEEHMETEVPLSNTTPAKQQTGRIFVHKVPDKISFGQGIARGFMSSRGRGRGRKSKKHWHNKDAADTDTTIDIESVTMKDLSEALT